jgi:hypothetical protein
MPNFGKQRQNLAAVPAKLGPRRSLVNIGHNLREICGEYGAYSPQGQEIPDSHVVTNGDNLRAELFPFVPVRQNGRLSMSGINRHKSTSYGT